MNIIILTGPPYSGKGTQAEIIENKYGYGHISTGERCRAEKENETYIGNIMSQYEETVVNSIDGIGEVEEITERIEVNM